MEVIASSKIIRDIGSGVNYRKKGLNRLLSILVEGQATRKRGYDQR